MRVIHVDTAAEWRGGQVQVLHLVRGMEARGMEPTLVCAENSRLSREVGFLGERRIVVPPGVSTRGALAVRQAAGDLVAAHTSHAHGLALLAGRPFVVHRRVDFVPTTKWKYARARGFVCVSQAVADVLRRSGFDRSVVVHSGVRPLPDADPAPDGPTVLAVGARVAHKGHAVLVAAAAQLDGVDVGVAGDGPLVYPGRVRWLGARSDVPALFRAARVFVHPSLEEGMGQVIVEAMLAGLPVVASDAGGIPEVVGDLGILVPRGDARRLAEAIRRVLAGDHPSVSAAHQRAIDHFSVEQMVAGTVAAYEQFFRG